MAAGSNASPINPSIGVGPRGPLHAAALRPGPPDPRVGGVPGAGRGGLARLAAAAGARARAQAHPNPELGGAPSGGADALLGRRTLAGLAANDHGDPLESRSIEVRYGYGFSALGDRFTSTPEIGFGLSNGHREYSLGWRLNLDQGGTSALGFALEASRREAVNDNGAGGSGAKPEHTAGFRVMARW